MNQEHFREAVAQLYALVRRLEEMFPGRPFTPDGHLVGSLGECLVAEAYGLNLMPPSNTGFDAMDPDGRRVEIKTTQGKSVAFLRIPTKLTARSDDRDRSPHPFFTGGVFVSRSVTMGQ